MPTLRDAIYGLAVGDALGVPYEFRPRGSFACTGMVGHGTHDQPAGTWSDDTSMTLATCDSIRACGRVDTADMLSRFRAWINDGAYAIDGVVFDYGGTTARALAAGTGCTGERDNGNGSLMRIAPLAFTGATDDEVRAVSAITHAHPVSTEACVDMLHVMRALAAGASPAEAIPDFDVLLAASEKNLGSGGFVRDTYCAALWCLVVSESYEECVLRAVNLGDDTDTTAAVAGALAGIVYGADAIPPAWMETLRGKDIIEACLFR